MISIRLLTKQNKIIAKWFQAEVQKFGSDEETK